jgi:hypothetical protein
MLALVSLSKIRTSAFRYLADSDLVDIASTASEIEDLFFVGAVVTDSSVTVNQEHTLSSHTS